MDLLQVQCTMDIHMCFKRHKMGIKLNILSILLHPSQFVYNFILSNFVFINFLIFWLYMEKLETLFFWRLSRRPDHYPDHLFVPACFALLAWTKYRLTCGAAILNLNIRDNKNIHQAPLVSAQPAASGWRNNLNLKADAIINFYSETLVYRL